MSRPVAGPRWALAWGLLAALLATLTLVLLGGAGATLPLDPALRLWPPLPAAAPGSAADLAMAAGEAPDVGLPRDLSPALDGWTVERGSGRVEVIDGILRLEAPRSEPYVLLRRPLPLVEGARGFRVRAEVRFSGFGGARPVDAARIHLQGRDAAGRLLPDRREDAFNARSTRDWASFEAVLAPPPEAATVELLVRLQRAVGRLELRSLEVAPLVEAPWLGPARLGLALVWLLVLGAGGALLLWAAPARDRAVAALAAAGGGLVLILAPPDLLARLLPQPLLELLERSTSGSYLGHSALGATLAFLAAWAAGARRFPLPALLVAILAIAGEAVQLLTVGRDTSALDALANAVGGFAGLGLALLFARLEDPRAGAEPVDEPPAAIETALPLVPLEAPGGPPR